MLFFSLYYLMLCQALSSGGVKPTLKMSYKVVFILVSEKMNKDKNDFTV